jgi:hypothetical protein
MLVIIKSADSYLYYVEFEVMMKTTVEWVNAM